MIKANIGSKIIFWKQGPLLLHLLNEWQVKCQKSVENET